MKKLILLIPLLFLIIVFRFFFFFQNQISHTDGDKLDFVTRLTEEPQVVFGKVQFKVRVDNGEKITIITGLKPILQYGDRVRIKGTVSTKPYKDYIMKIMEYPEIEIVYSDEDIFTSALTSIRRHASDFYGQNMPLVSAGLLNGIIFGGNQGLNTDFVKDLRSSGVMHVIAASGMNVTFVASFLIGIFGVIFHRKIAITIAIFGIIFYTFLSGLQPSIIRAAIMSILAFSASFFGRQNLSLVAIFITGYIMLLINPILLGDIGFQLSFLATLGILLIKPIISMRGQNFIFDDLGTTIAAQVATLPILLSVFGSYGVLSIMVNAMLLWTVPILMILGSLALIFSIILEPLGKLFLFLTLPILFFFEETVTFFGNLGWTLTIPHLPEIVWIGYYLVVFSALLATKKKK